MDDNDPIVQISTGLIAGTVTEDGIAVFRGIPYARPPVGPLRFAAPQPARYWAGVRDATTFGPPPPQSSLLPLALPAPASGTDPHDWLTVNVWSPDLRGAGLPVLVWIYGGAYRFGASSQPTYDGTRLAAGGLVVVTFNYRIGVEGFAQIPGKPPNRGLLDVVAALRWVKQCIAAFGGDPDNITVAGESAGAGAVASLLVMPMARGLFRRAIAQSVPCPFFAPQLAARISVAIAEAAGIPVAGFADADPLALAAASDKVVPRHHQEWGIARFADVPFAPIIDGEILPGVPWRSLAEGASHEIDLLTGHTKDEYRLFLEFGGLRGKVTAEMADDVLDGLLPDGARLYRHAYPDAGPETLYELVCSDWLFRMPTLHLAQSHAAGGGRTFLYELTYQAGQLGACHALDVPLVFGTRAELGEFLLGARPPREALALGDLMRAEWTAFAATGDPGWPPYAPGRRLTRIYAEQPAVAPYPEEPSMHLWDQRRLGALDLPA